MLETESGAPFSTHDDSEAEGRATEIAGGRDSPGGSEPINPLLRLRRIDLQGFKTFANRTSFEFTAPITAIVGPNGSGKSNLADAIRWVLGEQSLRAVRGKKTEDVIFAGGAGRAPAGMAEVTLTLDNADGLLALPYGEVTLTRRAYRSGENEYIVNRGRVRLRDLTDLLLKARLTQNAYTIIGQGMIDAILNQRPEERRELLEEAADVRRYYVRIAESQSRLAEIEQNLLRALDIVAELRPRLELLERQATRALEHKAIVGDLQAAQKRWFAHRLYEYLAARQAAEERERVADQVAQEHQNTEEALRQSMAGLEAQCEEQRREIAHLRSQLTERREELAHWRQQAELAAELGQTYRQQRRDLEDEAQELAASCHRTRQSIEQREAAAGDLNDQRERAKALLLDTERKLDRHRSQHRDILALAAQRRQELPRLESACLELRREAELWRGRKERLEERLEAHAQATAEQLRRQAAVEAALRNQEAELERCAQEERRLRERATHLAAQVEEREQSEREAAAHVEKLERELNGLQARLDVIRQSQQAHTGYYSGVKAVLAASRAKNGRKLEGIVGPVSGLLRAPASLELAIEVALGAHVQDLVVERWENAEAAIAHLKCARAGRATFLPLDTIRWSPARSAPDGPGVLGVASRLVEYDSRHQSVAEHLLGRTLVVADLEVARETLHKLAPGWQIVTLGGEIVRASGAITGGAAGAQLGLLSRARELRDLPRRARELAQEAEKARAQVAAAKADRQQAAQESTRKQREALEAEARCRRAKDALSRLRQESAALVSDLQAAEAGRTALAAEAAGLARVLRDAEARLAEAEQSREALARDQGSEEAALATLAQQEEALQANLARQRTELALQSQRAEALEEQLGALRQSLASTEAQLNARLSRIQELSLAEAGKARQETAARQQAEKAAQEAADLEARLAPAEQGLERLTRELMSQQREREVQRERRSQAEDERRQAAVEMQRALGLGETLRQEVERDLGAVVDPLAADAWTVQVGAETMLLAPQPARDARGLRSEMERQRSRLRALGAVNHEAVEEYAQVKERYSFLRSQVEDLQRAADSLRQVIAELQATARQLLEQSFTAVAAEFRRCFVALFQGGSAHLSLTNPDDLSQTGIEIVAQPPGKRSQSLALLSGGERALTGVALLFAVLRAHPIPFCFLDEVDAALDEANVGRFCVMLRQLSARTQFVLVTHNRLTMEAAGALYGVSLSDGSVSRIVSLRLDGRSELDDPAS